MYILRCCQFLQYSSFINWYFAFIAVSISKFFLPETLAHIPDGIASGIIALMLLFLAGYMLKNKSIAVLFVKND